MKRACAVLAIVSVLALGGFGSSSAVAATGGPITTQRVRILVFAFYPNVFKVSSGATVTVKNLDWSLFQEPHTFTALDGSFDSGPILATPVKVVAPDAPGNYQFHCLIHPFMNGLLVVTG